MKKEKIISSFLLILFFIVFLPYNGLSQEKPLEQNQIILIKKLKLFYNFRLETNNFLSKWLINLFAGDLLKNSKKIIWEETKIFFKENNQKRELRELKIKNLKNNSFYLFSDGNKYLATFSLKKKRKLNREVTKNLIFLISFLESNLKPGDHYNFSFASSKKIYKAVVKIKKLTDCNQNNICQKAFVYVDISKKKNNKKIINIAATINKNNSLNGKFSNIKIKTFFFPQIIIYLTLEK